MTGRFFVLLFLPSILLSCKSESIHFFTTPKHDHTPRPSFSQSSDLQFTAPSTWLVGPASGMRVGTFIVPSSSDERGVITLILLPESAGELRPNLDRWRGQLNLGPSVSPESEIKDRFIVGHSECLFFDLSSEDGFQKRFLIGMIRHDDQVLFVKLSGASSLVGAHLDEFKTFLKGVSFGSH